MKMKYGCNKKYNAVSSSNDTDTRILYYGSNVFCDIKLSDSKQRYTKIYGENRNIHYMRKKITR